MRHNLSFRRNNNVFLRNEVVVNGKKVWCWKYNNDRSPENKTRKSKKAKDKDDVVRERIPDLPSVALEISSDGSMFDDFGKCQGERLTALSEIDMEGLIDEVAGYDFDLPELDQPENSIAINENFGGRASLSAQGSGSTPQFIAASPEGDATTVGDYVEFRSRQTESSPGPMSLSGRLSEQDDQDDRERPEEPNKDNKPTGQNSLLRLEKSNNTSSSRTSCVDSR